MNGILDGVKVLDLSRVMSGPYCTLMLADLGAEVFKIEDLSGGDDTRRMTPLVKTNNGKIGFMYFNLNKNKKVISLNLKPQEGREIFLEMVKKVDIVVENFAPGVLNKLGIGYEELKKVNPSIILASISGFGQNGPYKNYPGYDGVAQAMSGIMTVNGTEDDPPMKSGPSFVDSMTSIHLATGILSAYIRRLRTGEGEWVETSLIDVGVQGMVADVHTYRTTGKPSVRTGNRNPLAAPFNLFPASDGKYIYISIENDEQFRSFCEVIGRPDLQEDSLYKKSDARVKNYQGIEEITSAWTMQHTAMEAEAILTDARIPAAAVRDVKDVVKDPHFLARKIYVEKEHPQVGSLLLQGCPLKFSSFDSEINFLPAVEFGADDAEIYGKLLGYNEQKLQSLREKGIIANQ